jgi:hypothetical protein
MHVATPIEQRKRRKSSDPKKNGTNGSLKMIPAKVQFKWCTAAKEF